MEKPTPGTFRSTVRFDTHTHTLKNTTATKTGNTLTGTQVKHTHTARLGAKKM